MSNANRSERRAVPRPYINPSMIQHLNGGACWEAPCAKPAAKVRSSWAKMFVALCRFQESVR